jgi:glycosyltransferase involved in cell wall biosynthesis
MRIFMVSSDYLPNIGGLAAHVYYLSESLLKLGHEVIVCAHTANGGRNVALERHGQVPCLRRSFSPVGGTLPGLAQRRMVTLGLIKEAVIRFGSPYVLHQHDLWASVAAMNASKRRAKWMWTNHTSGFLSDYDRPRRRKFLRYAFRNVDGVVAVSEEIATKSRQLFGEEKVQYIPNGVDTSRFKPGVDRRAEYGLSPSDFVVLCPRRMVVKNGVVYLARAVEQLLQNDPHTRWRFVFLGDDIDNSAGREYVRSIKHILAPYERDRSVMYLGNVALDRMPDVNSLADVVVIPSLVEAVSLSALEAMAARKPVIASAVGGLPEIVRHGDTGHLVPPADPAALAAALQELRFNAALRAEYGFRAEALVSEEYSWLSIATRTASYYARLLRPSLEAEA